MSWNYRLVVTAEDETDRDITVCEVYYNDAGKPNGYVDTAPPAGSDIHEALVAYEAMGSAFRKPVLRPDEDGRLVEVDFPTECGWSDRTQADAGGSWLFPGPIESCADHRGPEGPNEDLAQCPHCGAPTFAMRPEWETFGDHLPDCSLSRRHKGHCQPGGSGHPSADVIRGYWPPETGSTRSTCAPP